MELKSLQKKYPRFIYEAFHSRFLGKNLEIYFDFRIEPDIIFKPKLTIKNVKKVPLSNLNNLIFHLGLIEMLSYWKSTCSPIIEIRAGYLEKQQIEWWQDLIVKGMGQFFFENKIKFQKPKFVIESAEKYDFAKTDFKKSILVPVGGGKDSAVTIELVRKSKIPFSCFSLNPTKSAKKIMRLADRKSIIVERKIDKRLLHLNLKGFLNGHTPFSAYLAFLSQLLAEIFGFKYIALSNERSSNEGNLKYLDKVINHQWSKSFEFEKRFRKYSNEYLSRAEYFSFLRPFYELQIARMFSKHKKYFPVFLSCNEASKTASGTRKPASKWCLKCSKCLFAFAILYSFLKEKEILKIFKKNLFQNKSLIPLMEELVGEKGFKPFECVGTKRETLAAFYLSWKKTVGVKPVLLKYFEDKVLPKHKNMKKETKDMLKSYNNQNNLPERINLTANS